MPRRNIPVALRSPIKTRVMEAGSCFTGSNVVVHGTEAASPECGRW
jgi:hypothetical protein